ncbi:hypothetical protein BY996DRAFT_7304478 [Phakopsora pachyrhizi]|nr:hypothetical protein BY996DRAFT_7304478 [Phakopsora pachyrhizi]
MHREAENYLINLSVLLLIYCCIPHKRLIFFPFIYRREREKLKRSDLYQSVLIILIIIVMGEGRVL